MFCCPLIINKSFFAEHQPLPLIQFQIMKKSLFVFLLVVSLSLIKINHASAQCALCKASAESNLNEGKKSTSGLNMGIVYLLSVPYLLVGGIGYFWYVKKKKQAAEENSEI